MDKLSMIKWKLSLFERKTLDEMIEKYENEIKELKSENKSLKIKLTKLEKKFKNES